jgi:2-dehydro-3-deoxyphosphogluconate aldolase/(4S)-4-hydroxy-2-oxoglutarate aldolase
MSVNDAIFTEGLVPVLTINRVDDAVPLCKALLAGGLSTAEISFSTGAAAASIAAVRKELPQMKIGAGNVSTLEQVKEALAAGALFMVSPSCNPELVKYCLGEKLPVFPGCATASEVDAALRLGLQVLQFFPAEQSGGLPAIKALSDTFPHARFRPAGGISLKNLAPYLACLKVVACGGSFMAPDELIRQGRWDEITALAHQAAAAAQGFELAHLGLHSANEAEAKSLANDLAKLTALPVKNGNSSLFVGTGVEVVKSTGDFSTHLAYSVLNVERSARYLAANGFALDENSIKRDAEGAMTVVYLRQRFGGVAIHLVARKI